MPAAARAGERRPSAATAKAARNSLPPGRRAVTRSSAISQRSTIVSCQRMSGVLRIAASSALFKAWFGMFSPKCGSRISLAWKVTTGLRTRRLVPSTIRMMRRGAASGSTSASTPRLSRKASAGIIRAVVRPSVRFGSGPARRTEKPSRARARAASMPAGPVPAITTSLSCFFGTINSIRLPPVYMAGCGADQRGGFAHGPATSAVEKETAFWPR